MTDTQHGQVFYDSVLNTVHDGLWVTDSNDRIIFFNKSMESIAGVAATDMIGLCVVTDFSEETTGEFLSHYFKARDTLESVAYEATVVTPAGRHTIQSGWLTPRFENGQYAGMICTIQDVSEARRTEQALLEAGERAQRFLDIAPAIIISLDKIGKITLLNQEGARILECVADEALGKDWFETFLPEANRNEVRDVFTRLMVGELENIEHYENEVVAQRSGRLRLIRWHNSLITDDKVGIAGLLSSGEDVTEQRAAAEQLRSIDLKRIETAERLAYEQRRYLEIFEGSRDGYVMVDLDGRIIDANQAYCNMVGYSLNELQELKDFYEITPERWREWEAEEIWKGRLLKRGYSGLYAKEYIRKGGTMFPVELQAFAAADENGKTEFFWATVRDITERKQAEEVQQQLSEQLAQAQKMESVGRLAGGIAHDFNNMLNVILGNADLIYDDLAADDPMREDIDEIRKAAHRSADLTRQLLGFARRQTVTPIMLDLNDTIETMLKMLRRLIGEEIELSWQPAETMETICMDPAQIDQLLANLVVNGRDAIGGVGRITIETKVVEVDEDYCSTHAGFAPGQYVMLAVSDNGRGMDAETKAQIFEPFFTTKGVGEGTGLGLATVYGIVKQNNGFVEVYSEPELGTTFRIFLPASAPDKTERRRRQDALLPAAGSGETILLVEDEASILSVATKILGKLGYNVLSASTPGEAIQYAREHSGEIHLLITDVVMPEMNGRDLAQQLLSLYPNVARLFMSGYTANVIAHKGILDKGVNFLQKPFSMEQLAESVRTVLDKD